MGVEGLDRECHPRDQSAAADRHHHGVDLGKLFEQLEADRPLSGDDVFIVEGVDKGIVFLIPQLKRPLVRVVVHPSDQLDPGSVFFVASTLEIGAPSGRQMTDLMPFLVAASATPGHGCRRAGDDAVSLFLVGELGNLIIRPPHLKGAGHLEVFGFQIHRAVVADVGRVDEIGRTDDVLEDERRMYTLSSVSMEIPRFGKK